MDHFSISEQLSETKSSSATPTSGWLLNHRWLPQCGLLQCDIAGIQIIVSLFATNYWACSPSGKMVTISHPPLKWEIRKATSKRHQGRHKVRHCFFSRGQTLAVSSSQIRAHIFYCLAQCILTCMRLCFCLSHVLGQLLQSQKPNPSLQEETTMGIPDVQVCKTYQL